MGNTSSTRWNARHAYNNAANYNLLPSITGADTAPTANVWKPRTQPMWQKRRRNFETDPKLVVARPTTEAVTIWHYRNWTGKGMKSRNLTTTYRQGNSPKHPKHRRKSSSPKRKEYEQAVQTFERRNEEYARKVEELDRMKEEGRIKAYVKVGQTEPELCYVEINRKGNRSRHYRDIAGKGQAFQTAFHRKDRCRYEKDCPGERLSRKPVHAVRRRYGLFCHACPTSKETFPAFRHQGPAFRIGRETADENCSQTDGCTKDPHQTGLHQSLSL